MKLVANHEVYSGGTSKPRYRDDFVRDMDEMDFNCVVEKWFNSKNEWKKEIYYHFPGFIRNLIKSIAGL